jgi:hypothetical protein
MENFQNEISSLNNFRYSIIRKRNSFYNEEKNDYDYPELAEDEKKIDDIAAEIEKSIRDHFEFLPFDFIMEQLANLGHAPNLLYDDNGLWAVTSTGFQTVVCGDEAQDVETHFFVDMKYWKNTPKEALHYYLNNDDDE